jgi:hypothetical protein
MQDTPDMVRMVDDLELLLNQLGNPARGPYLRSPAKGEGTLYKKLQELILLVLAQSGRSAWGRTHLQALLSQRSPSISPSQHRTCVAAYAPGDLVQ